MKSLPFALAAATLFVAASASPSQAASGQDLVQQGNDQGAVACAACHGPDGAGNPQAGYPRLAGLDAGYIVRQLDAFAAGTRDNAIMAPIAKALKEPDREAVAGYLAGLHPAAAEGGEPPEPGAIAGGARIAQHGDWSKGVPGCGQCHGAAGDGVGSDFPRLAGQSALYIVNQLQAWQEGRRKDDQTGLMAGIAARLSGAQVKDAAAYYASLGLPAAGSTPKPPSYEGAKP